MQDKLNEALAGEKVDGIFCVAGGWAGGNAANKGIYSCFRKEKNKIKFVWNNLYIKTKSSLNIRFH